MGDGIEIIGQQPRLIVKARAANIVIDFLQANQVGVFLLDDFDHPLEPVTAVAAANPFVNVVTEQPHGRWWQGGVGKGRTCRGADGPAVNAILIDARRRRAAANGSQFFRRPADPAAECGGRLRLWRPSYGATMAK